MYLKTMRVFFQKTGRTIYTSHLDMNRAMSRALARSGLPVWYTLGFHPHLYITFALPLSLGTTGLYETVDFRLLEEVENSEIIRKLNLAMPEGLRVFDAAEPVMEPKAIFWADYSIKLRCNGKDAMEALEKFVAIEEILMEKKSKKGMKTIDIKPLFQLVDISEIEGGALLKLRCRAGVETNLNPTLALDAVEKLTGFRAMQALIERTAVYNENLELFR